MENNMKNEKTQHVETRPASGETRAERPQRVPINGERDILKVIGIRPGFRPCWVNQDQVPRFQAAGYSFVESDVTFGSYHVQQGNPLGARYARDVGSGQTAYLMEIPEEWYQEMAEAEARDLEKAESSMKANARASGLDHGDLQINTNK
jgi:lysozyme family protein